MATVMQQVFDRAGRDLRVHRVEKWVRAMVGERTVVDSRRAALVWEPRRVVPSYAVPESDIAGELVAAGEVTVDVRPGPLTPHAPFTVHSTPGTSLTVRTADGVLPDAAFRADDPDLAGWVVLDWQAFGQWYEEDEPVMAHPHDPFKRIDCLRSGRRVVLSHAGVVLADTRRATLLFETGLPVRYYLPREDVAVELLGPTGTRSVCAYKGVASSWSARVGDEVLDDIAWSYEDPLHDGQPVRGLVAFWTEKLDLTVDGVALEQERTFWP